jgi:hypothetical protein
VETRTAMTRLLFARVGLFWVDLFSGTRRERRKPRRRYIVRGMVWPALLLGVATVVAAQEGPPLEQRLEQLKEIQARRQHEIMQLPGVNGIGIGRDKNSGELVFLVVVDKHAPMPPLPERIEGVPVVVERHERIMLQEGGLGCVPCHADPQPLPVEMGNSQFTDLLCQACTMGFKACDLDTRRLVFVTNDHCSADATRCEGSAPLGTRITSPAPFDNFPRCTLNVGCNGTTCTLGADIGDVSENGTITCGASDTVDASVVDSDDTLTSNTIRDIGTPSTIPGTVMPGDMVQKSGRTTGLTFGTVGSVNFMFSLSYVCCATVTFVGQILVNADDGCSDPPCVWSQGGDSGSAVLTRADPPQIVGLHFAGTPDGSVGIANQIRDVLNRFNLTLDLDQCGPRDPNLPPFRR